MKFRNRLAGLLTATLVASGATVGVGVLAAAPAQAASCTYSSLTASRVYNNTCTKIQHFDVISGKSYVYAPAAGKAKWSTQSACWANITAYGFTYTI